MTDEYGRKHTDGSRSGGQPVDDSIKAKALALVNEVQDERLRIPFTHIARDASACEALCRAIEAHEADKAAHASQIYAMHSRIALAEEQHEAYKQEHEKFKWEVSFAVLSAMKVLLEMAEHDCEVRVRPILERFIIPKPKPDPLVEAWIEATGNTVGMEPLNAALEARGLKIVEKGQ